MPRKRIEPPFWDNVEEIKKIEYAKNIYYEAKYKGKEIVIAYSKIGKVFASLTATILIEKFGCNQLLFSGVAGAINPELKIGDLIIAKSYVNMIWILLHLGILWICT